MYLIAGKLSRLFIMCYDDSFKFSMEALFFPSPNIVLFKKDPNSEMRLDLFIVNPINSTEVERNDKRYHM